MTIANHVTGALFTVTNPGINILGPGIVWFTLRVSHTKITGSALLDKAEHLAAEQHLNKQDVNDDPLLMFIMENMPDAKMDQEMKPLVLRRRPPLQDFMRSTDQMFYH